MNINIGSAAAQQDMADVKSWQQRCIRQLAHTSRSPADPYYQMQMCTQINNKTASQQPNMKEQHTH
jgi:hypothetical protein